MLSRNVRTFALAVFMVAPALVLCSPGSNGAPLAGKAVPAPVLIYAKGAPGATGDSDEDKPAIYPVLPASEKNTGAAILICPGGGMSTRCVDSEGVLVAQWLKDHGVAGFILRYRIRPLYGPADAHKDHQRALQFVRAHADEFHIDPSRIGIMGFSAGAAQCCWAAFDPLPGDPASADPVERAPSNPNFLIPVYGQSNDTLAQVKEGVVLPPTFMYCTGEDGAVSGMMTMHTLLRQKGVPTEVHFFTDGPHGTGMALGDPILGQWPNLLYSWMRHRGFLTSVPRVAIKGLVKVDGEPLARGSVIFRPVDTIGAPAVVGYIFNSTPGGARGEYVVNANLGPIPGRYRVEVREEAKRWLSNFNNPMIKKLSAFDRLSDVEKKELLDYGRTRNLEPSVENQRVYRKARPSDANELVVEVKSGANRVDVEVSGR